MIRIVSIHLVLWLLTSTFIFSAETLPPWKIPPPEWFLKQIPPPPASNSLEEKEDLAEVIKLQSVATPQQVAQAQWTFKLSLFTFGEVLNKNFTPANYPQSARFFLLLNNLVAAENDYLKNYYRRPHPFEVDGRHVRQIVVAPPGFSYPSFHTARCVVFVNVLETLDPSRRSLFQRVAKQVEVDRVFAGEHFPSDIRAGKKLGNLIYGELVKDKDFLEAVQELKADEWTPPPSFPAKVNIPIP